MLSIDDMSARTASTAIYHFESSLGHEFHCRVEPVDNEANQHEQCEHCRQVREQHAEHAAFVIEIEE